MHKWLYKFSDKLSKTSDEKKLLLGGKGANLAEMTQQLKLPVPPGFTITTEVCNYFYSHNKILPGELIEQVNNAIKDLEKSTGKKFGVSDNPLLVSVRSGAKISMPGMMDTILNLGLNDTNTETLAQATGDERFAYDSYRRFIQMYGDVVMGVDHYLFEDVITEKKLEYSVIKDCDFPIEVLKDIILKFKDIIAEKSGKDFPQNPETQLWDAIRAVLRSWSNERAQSYRRIHKISGSSGTAVNIQAMVFGNMGDDSATGVLFTRNPSTGENHIYGEYLRNAQGEDVVAGIRTPDPIKAKELGDESMESQMPELYEELIKICYRLEHYYKDMQDIEFTIEKGKLYILQTRSGKRTIKAAVKIATDLVKENRISKADALMMIDADSIDQLLHENIDGNYKYKILTKGLPASPGAATGSVVFSAEEAEQCRVRGQSCILVRKETSPEDINGMNAAAAIITSRGGMTSHAAVVARGMGKPSIVGANQIIINADNKSFTVGDKKINEGELITVNGALGEIIEGKLPMVRPEMSLEFEELMNWADEHKRLSIRVNAEVPKDVAIAKKFGAKGIGLCRTEHMFFQPDRVSIVRQMILSGSKEARMKALEQIMPMQQEDFYKIFAIMDGMPVNIRLLDPPLHEFLPRTERDFENLAELLNISVISVKKCC